MKELIPLNKHYKAVLSYDGSRYDGWQKQGNTENTIQGKLEALLSRMSGKSVEVSGSGRTDAGVHALGQVASFDLDSELDCAGLLLEINSHLPEDIALISIEEAPPRFHARLSAKRKTYVYRIWNSPIPNVMERKYLWRVPEPLDLQAIRSAAELLLGRHDFMCFCANRRMKKSTVRTLYRVDLERLGDELRFTLEGDGFLYNMVRIIVGTLVEVGRGHLSAKDVSDILSSRSRDEAGPTAPARGLVLKSVEY